MLEKDHLGDWSPDKDFFLTLGIIMSLPSSMVHFVPCDRLLQKAYFNARFKKKIMDTLMSLYMTTKCFIILYFIKLYLSL